MSLDCSSKSPAAAERARSGPDERRGAGRVTSGGVPRTGSRGRPRAVATGPATRFHGARPRVGAGTADQPVGGRGPPGGRGRRLGRDAGARRRRRDGARRRLGPRPRPAVRRRAGAEPPRERPLTDSPRRADGRVRTAPRRRRSARGPALPTDVATERGRAGRRTGGHPPPRRRGPRRRLRRRRHLHGGRAVLDAAVRCRGGR